jgi:hypothetical protein
MVWATSTRRYDRRVLRRALIWLPPLRFAYRLAVLWTHRRAARARPREGIRYLLRGREFANFTYDLANLDELTAVLAGALEIPEQSVSSHLRELREDHELRERLAAKLRKRPNREPEPLYGGRLLL